MDNLKLIKNNASYLFTKDDNCEQSSYLSEFMAYIKSKKIISPYKFSYVGDQTNLIPHLSLTENILMNFSPKSLTTEKIHQFEEFLNLSKNYYIKKLFNNLTDKDMTASIASPEMKKLASLICTLTSDSEYIFLENPEKDLSENIRILFSKALEIRLGQNESNAFIFCSDINEQEAWKTQCSFSVSRNNYFQFHTESIIVDKTTKKIAA